MWRMFLVFVGLPTLFFAQISLSNPNLDAYIGEQNVGLQVNPALTGAKGTIQNQEFDLNLALFYQNKYTMTNRQVIGVVKGRLITEFPLSSFNVLADIRTNNELTLSNYAAQNPEFQRAYNEYKRLIELELNPTKNLQDQIESVPTNVEENVEEMDEMPEDYVDEYGEQEADDLAYKPLKFIAQNIASNQNPIQTFSVDEFFIQHYNNPNISQKDLSFLLHYEQIKEAYQNLLQSYNEHLSNENNHSKKLFDPTDPAEEFTVYLVGDQTKHIWAKKFTLGRKNYQSYNDIVWYLEYEVPITKKDVRALYDVFQKNHKVSYYVQGAGGRIDFHLKEYFIKAAKELLDLYARGAFVVDPNTEFPILRNDP